jgi:hypothetical protein
MGWTDRGTPPGVLLVGDPDAASWPSGTTDSGHIEVVCSASDGSIRTFRYDDGATAWGVLPPPPNVTFLPSPTVTGMGDGRYLVAAISGDGAVWQRLQNWNDSGVWVKTSIPAGAIAIDATSY